MTKYNRNKGPMNKSYLTGEIYFSFSFNLSYIDEIKDKERKNKTLEWETDCIYRAIIKDVNGEISIQLIGSNKEEYKSSINFMCRQWNDYIPSFEFGKYLEIHEAYIGDVSIELDLSSTRLKRIVSSYDCYCCLHIDRYQYSYAQENEKSSITYYLYETSKNLIGDFLELNFVTGHVEPKKLTLSEDFSCIVDKNNEPDLFPIRIEFGAGPFLQDKIEKEFGLLCDIISFYYAIPIECGMSVIYEKDLVKIYREMSHYNACQKIIRNWDLCYLNYGTSHDIEDFLAMIYKNRTDLEDKLELLHTTMNDYVRSFSLDEKSCFLILYSVLETYSWKIEKEVVDEQLCKLYDELKCVFSSMYNDFLSRVDKEVQKCIKIETLWEKAKKSFTYPQKHSIVRLFEKHSIDNLKMNAEIEMAGLPCGEKRIMRNISDLRNQLVHNRNIDETYKLPMDKINTKLSFAVCIVLLSNLGFKQIAFHEDWSLLSILEEKPNDCLTND